MHGMIFLIDQYDREMLRRTLAGNQALVQNHL